MSKNIDKRINENTAAIHRKSVSKAFNAKPAPIPVSDKDANLEADAKALQELLGKDVNVSPVKKAKGGVVSNTSKRVGAMPTIEGMYVPEKEKGMYVPEKGMYVPEKSKAKPRAEEFDLHKTVKKSANEGGMKKGGTVSSASKRADGCAIKGKTRGKMV